MSGKVLLYRLGEAPDGVRERHGEYHAWFERAWGGPLELVDGRDGVPAPDPRDFAAILVSGSPASLVEPEPWMERAAELVVRARDAGTPLMGVCFGHQLIGHAAGARVIENPSGWEVGTCEVVVHEVGQRDPIFAGLGPALRVNLTHRDAIDAATLPDEVTVLAGNAHTEVQALAWGEHVRGVQFHPEIDGPTARAYVDARRERLAALDPDAVIARTVDSPDGVAVLRAFRAHFVGDGGA